MWFHVLLAALSLSLVFGSPEVYGSHVSNLIYGGVKQDQSFPPMVQLFTEGQSFCGGTILTKSCVVTSAQCAQSVAIKNITVYAGLANLVGTGDPHVQARKVTGIILHPQWNSETMVNDIAIIILDKELTSTEHIQPVQINVFDIPTELTPQQNTSIFGYGPEGDKNLFKVDTHVVPRQDCTTLWKDNESHLPITEDQVCTSANNFGIYPSDKGGPVIYFYHNLLTNKMEPRLVGIVSNFSEDPTYPDVHTRASSSHFNGIVQPRQVDIVSYGSSKPNIKIPNVHTRASRYCTWITQETEYTFICSLLP